MGLIAQVGQWFDRRLQLAAPIREITEHPVPRNTASWFYVFGSAALTVFILQLVTGILLALIYVPSASEAWSSLQALNHDVALGWFVRAMHGWGSNFMVAIVLIHMVQVFLFGAYKFPRELTWIIGVFLLLMTLGMAFTGQVLRFDQDAYWGLGIGASIASRVPDPIEKCAECRASPISTIFPDDQRSFQIHGKLRHTDLFDSSGWPSSVAANTCSQMACDSSTVLSAKP